MRKILMAAMLVMLPLSVYAAQPMTEANLDSITAQEGVKISFSGSGANGGLVVQTQAADIAWTNRDNLIETGIIQDVTQTGFNTIEVTGALTIEAKQVAGVDLVEIGLPGIEVTAAAKKTDIYITSKTHADLAAAKAYDAFIGDGIAAGNGKLGSQYTASAVTVIDGGKIQISSM